MDETHCYNCGKKFRNEYTLQRHKNRKTPCLIIEKPDNTKPYCIYCNRAFMNRRNLREHLTKCKIKNGRMDILIEKTRHEQELENRLKRLEDKNKQILEQLNKQKGAENIVNNTHNINNIHNGDNVTNNININCYKRPKIKMSSGEFIKMFREHKINTPLKMVNVIWFNPEMPENHSLFLVNKQTGEILVHTGENWVTENCRKVIPEVRGVAYGFVQHAGKKLLREEYELFILGNISKNLTSSEMIRLESVDIFNQMLDGRNMVKVDKNDKK